MRLILLGLVLLLVVVIISLIIFLPNVIHYTEKITISAPIKQVYDNIRSQADLMRWSAWPEATGSTCEVENTDGEVGARTVFFSDGKRFGHQEIIALEPNKKVSMTLVDSGPLKHTPYLDFHLRSLSDVETEVTLDFTNTYKKPFQVPAKLFGMVKWVRSLQIRDLEGLKSYSESHLRKS